MGVTPEAVATTLTPGLAVECTSRLSWCARLRYLIAWIILRLATLQPGQAEIFVGAAPRGSKQESHAPLAASRKLRPDRFAGELDVVELMRDVCWTRW